ncbi:MAG: helix-turn-helix domain-containing protein [Pseudomonadota bacterium]
MTNTPTHLTTEQLAERLHRKTQTLAHWRVTGEGPKFMPGRPVLYPIVEVEKWEAGQLRSSTAG